jgi:hypothetical protein
MSPDQQTTEPPSGDKGLPVSNQSHPRKISDGSFGKDAKIKYYERWIRDELYGSRYLAELQKLSKN